MGEVCCAPPVSESGPPDGRFREFRPWATWSQVPDKPPSWAYGLSFFCEIFSGVGGITDQVESQKMFVLPPVDVVIEGSVLAVADILDSAVAAKILAWIDAGVLRRCHFGTPCTTYSVARKFDGKGPPPLRSAEFPRGLPDVAEKYVKELQMGTLFMLKTVEFALQLSAAGGTWSIENPLTSLMWLDPAMIELAELCGAIEVVVELCSYGSSSLKPTKFLCTDPTLVQLFRLCPGESCSHKHVTLKGLQWHPRLRRWVHRTKLAQVYPLQLCVRYAELLKVSGDGPPCCSSAWPKLCKASCKQFEKNFLVSTPVGSRKRKLGDEVVFTQNKKALSGSYGVLAGQQLRKGLVEPLFSIELEPGRAVEAALQMKHPFAKRVTLLPSLEKPVDAVCGDLSVLVSDRRGSVCYWRERALVLKFKSLKLINEHPDRHIRWLFLKAKELDMDKLQERPLGSFVHIALLREMVDWFKPKDAKYVR